MIKHQQRLLTSVLRVYFGLTYLAILFNVAFFLRNIRITADLTGCFALSAYLVYSFIYLLPSLLLVSLCLFCLRRSSMTKLLIAMRIGERHLIYPVAVLSAGATQVFLYADRFIYQIYSFHLNGFVWNLLITPGGLQSLGGGSATSLYFLAIVAGIFSVQAALLMAAIALTRRLSPSRSFLQRKTIFASLIVLAALVLFEQITYGISVIRGHGAILVTAETFPLYLPITFTSIAKSLGINPFEEPSLAVEMGSGALKYPLRKLTFGPNAKDMNIVWLVSESLRWDMLTPEIMPATWALAQRSTWCHQHYSAGNGTRMAIFGMFYGLYGPYWFPFVNEARGPVFIEALLERGYDMHMYTSAGFSYPEFDKTVFVNVPDGRLHEVVALPIWRRDQFQVDLMLESLTQRDPTRPFMRFMFFESPHANYHFPEEAVIRRPYMEHLNYATMDVERDIEGMKNRYINACHFLDSQFARVISFLSEQNLLDSTILMITGDHGEEFMERGHWGHNSTFSEQQTRVPMVLWVPGKEPVQIQRITSHLDMPVTVLELLGCTSDPRDYSLGVNLCDKQGRAYTVIGSWNNLAYVDERFKAVMPMKAFGFVHQGVTTKDDLPVKDRRGFYQGHRDKLFQILQDLKRFKS